MLVQLSIALCDCVSIYIIRVSDAGGTVLIDPS